MPITISIPSESRNGRPCLHDRERIHNTYNSHTFADLHSFTPVVPPALTCFCALQDISPEMGPTTFIPQSATEEYHGEIQMRETMEILAEEGLLAESPNQLNTLGLGDCSLYNPMLLHCGGANRSNRRRVIFYFSFKNPKFDEKDWPLAYVSNHSVLLSWLSRDRFFFSFFFFSFSRSCLRCDIETQASLSPDLRVRGLTLPDIQSILKEWKKAKSG